MNKEILVLVDKLSFDELEMISKSLGNINRIRIVKLLKLNKGEMLLTKLSKEIPIAYKNVLEHIKILNNLKIITTTKIKNVRGQHIIIKLNDY